MRSVQINNYITDKRKRYGFIDSVRGLAVVGMIIYHLLFDVLYIYGFYPYFYLDERFIALQRFVGVTFFVVSGISVNFSARTFENGILVALCGLGVSAVTLIVMPEDPILYGVLTCLGFSMMLFAALKRPLSRVNALAGMIVSLVLYVLTYGVKNGFIGLLDQPLFYLPEQMYQTRLLAFFALPSVDFYSSDYYPIFPWIFLFSFGFFFWRQILKIKADKYFYGRVPVLDFIGRHSLIIYLAHQPVLYLICIIIFGY